MTSLNKKGKILAQVTKRSRGKLVFKFSWIEGLKDDTVHLLPWLFLSLCVAVTPDRIFLLVSRWRLQTPGFILLVWQCQ